MKVFGVLLALALSLLSHSAHALAANLFSNGFEFVQPVVANQLTRSGIHYGPYVLTLRPNVDVTEWNNIWGHQNPTDAVSPWPGVSGSSPVIAAFDRTMVLCIHFRTPAVVHFGMFTYPINWVAADQKELAGIDIAISPIRGDFHAAGAASRINQIPGDSVIMSYTGPQANPQGVFPDPSSIAVVRPNSDYYLNIRAHFPTGFNFPLYLQSVH